MILAIILVLFFGMWQGDKISKESKRIQVICLFCILVLILGLNLMELEKYFDWFLLAQPLLIAYCSGISSILFIELVAGFLKKWYKTRWFCPFPINYSIHVWELFWSRNFKRRTVYVFWFIGGLMSSDYQWFC